MELLFPRRIARVSYLCRTVLIVVMLSLLVSLGDTSLSASDGHIPLTVYIVALTLVAYWLVFVILQRCRDLAMSGWFTLLVLVPGIDLFFCGYLAWGKTKVRADWTTSVASAGTGGDDAARQEGKRTSDLDPRSEALRKLQCLRDSGVITEGQFERMKAQRRL